MNGDTWQVLRIGPGDPRFGWARSLEFELFGVANGYASPSDRAAGRMCWYDPYESASEFYVAFGKASDVVGIARLIRHHPERGMRSFSTVVDAASYAPPGGTPRAYIEPQWVRLLEDTSPTAVAELATQAVHRAHRRRGAVDHLWLHMLDASRAEGVELWTMALVVPLYRWYKATFPHALEAIGSTMPDYVGADSVPAVLWLTHAEVDLYRKNFVAGIGPRGEQWQ
jgi:ribosomal protein S18 acetylase RimI-like enzyme